MKLKWFKRPYGQWQTRWDWRWGLWGTGIIIILVIILIGLIGGIREWSIKKYVIDLGLFIPFMGTVATLYTLVIIYFDIRQRFRPRMYISKAPLQVPLGAEGHICGGHRYILIVDNCGLLPGKINRIYPLPPVIKAPIQQIEVTNWTLTLPPQVIRPGASCDIFRFDVYVIPPMGLMFTIKIFYEWEGVKYRPLVKKVYLPLGKDGEIQD